MSVSLKQARRMVAKSRRRVWRLCRRTQGEYALRLWHAMKWGADPNASARLLALSLRNGAVRGASDLDKELRQRQAILSVCERARRLSE